MIRIAICDDDETVIQNMEQILEAYAKEYEIQMEFGMFYDGEQLLTYMKNAKHSFDMIFLDIEMKQMDGLETAEKLREMDRTVLLVYVTSHESYALRAYRVHPFDFLVKPVNEKKVEACFRQAYALMAPEEQYYDFMFNKNRYHILINEIMYIMSNRRVIEMHMSDGTIKKHYGKLDEVEKQLKSGIVHFWRIHKSTLVNPAFIFRKSHDYVELKNGQRLSISEEREKELNANYIQDVVRRRSEQ